jgi:lipid A oxidase
MLANAVLRKGQDLMLGHALRLVGRVHIVLIVLAVVALLSEPVARRFGDRFQVALPMLAWGCAAMNRSGGEFAARFFGMMVVAHGTKAALGDAEINMRPSGGDAGFPSAHTSAAALGASSLVHDCIADHPVAKGVVLITAAFVGASRIEADKHDIWQVLAGGLLGWGSDRVLRRPSRQRAAIQALAARLSRRAAIVARSAMNTAIAITRAVLRLGPVRHLGRIPVGISFFLVLLAGTVQMARAEFTISAYGGLQTTQSGTIDSTELGRSDVEWASKPLSAPPYYGFRATWWQSETIGFGLEFNHAKVYAKDRQSLGYDRLELTDGLNLITANIFRRWPGKGRFTPYVGAGVGVAFPYVEVEPIGQVGTYEYQLTGPAVVIMAGTDYRINERWSLFGEYKGSWSDHEADLKSGGNFSTEIVTHAINLGVSYSF